MRPVLPHRPFRLIQQLTQLKLRGPYLRLKLRLQILILQPLAGKLIESRA
ncbi:protein of unknown function [Paraburkholderia dioscoreae]|uniref:Uncharacterized protein n=1 Tax=Paraburkholderia dioscoreae TaxID=2604047 RepID=A0A5Q4Z246_9BURK|nr:protein of unknown function [Paraburkholderia dioscoreae]